MTTKKEEIPFDINDKYWDTVHPGMPERIIHRLILVRHGESESNIELTTTGKTTEYAIDHELTELGKEQAQDVANFLETKGIIYITRIEISPLERAIQTAIPFLLKNSNKQIETLSMYYVNYELREKYTKPPYWCKMPHKLHNICPYYKEINFDANHNCVLKEKEWIRVYENCLVKEAGFMRMPETDIEFNKRIEELISVWKSRGSVDRREQTLVVTHSQVISRILSSDKSFHLANGSISIIDIDEKHNLHVQMANYTTHLKNPTGMHTCIF